MCSEAICLSLRIFPTFFHSCGRECCPLHHLGEIAVSRGLLQKLRKQRLLRQIRMAMSSAFTLVAPHCCHQYRHHEFKGREINDLQKWRRGWDSNPTSLRNFHRYW